MHPNVNRFCIMFDTDVSKIMLCQLTKHDFKTKCLKKKIMSISLGNPIFNRIRQVETGSDVISHFQDTT